MSIHPVDLAILIGYFVGVVALGVYLSKRAAKNLDSYFLGGRSLPWYLLGGATIFGSGEGVFAAAGSGKGAGGWGFAFWPTADSHFLPPSPFRLPPSPFIPALDS